MLDRVSNCDSLGITTFPHVFSQILEQSNLRTHQHAADRFRGLRRLKGMERKVKRRRRRSEGTCRSLILKKLASLLLEGRLRHLLRWERVEHLEFSVKYVHKSSPSWSESDLDLFKEMDGLSGRKMANYEREHNYDCRCKVRFKSNMKKLSHPLVGPLQYLDEVKDGNSVTYKTYRFRNVDIIQSVMSESRGSALEVGQHRAAHSERKREREQVAGSHFTESGDGFSFDGSSHYQCVSKEAVPGGGGVSESVAAASSLCSPSSSWMDTYQSIEVMDTCGSDSMCVPGAGGPSRERRDGRKNGLDGNGRTENTHSLRCGGSPGNRSLHELDFMGVEEFLNFEKDADWCGRDGGKQGPLTGDSDPMLSAYSSEVLL